MKIESFFKIALIATTSCCLSISCKDKDKHKNSSDDNNTEVCRFISDVMYEYYYWLKDMPETDYTKESDPLEYFEKLCSKEDYFSFITENAQEELEYMDGEEKDKGWLFSFEYTDANMYNVLAVVKYVHKDTPAYAAGARRGDVILTVNNEQMNTNNYMTLFGSASAVYTGFRYNRNTHGYDAVEYEIADSKNTKNAVSEHAIFDGNIGYLLYTQYTSAFNDDLDKVAEEFKAAGVKNVILDLRYNLGGYNDAMRHLCSILAPKSAVESGSTIIWFEFNEILSKISTYQKENTADKFEKDVKVNLDLEKVVFITSGNTYSSSEATIIGLQPYMQTYCIGQQTGGKNYTMQLFTPEDFTDRRGKAYYDSSINNWMLVPIIARYRNSQNYTFASNQGIVPDYQISELNFEDMGVLGSPDEPLTAAAIEYIKTGAISNAGNKATSLRSSLEINDTSKRGYMIMK